MTIASPTGRMPGAEAAPDEPEPAAAPPDPAGTGCEPPAAESAVPEDRRHRRTLRTRQAIESAALRLFQQQGFDPTTVEQIAEEADIAPRTFFRHFPSKDAVLFGDSKRETEQMRRVLTTRPADEHPLRSLTMALVDSAERVEADRKRHLVRAQLFTELEGNRDYEKHLMRQQWVQDYTDLVAERLGTDVDDPRASAWALMLAGAFGSAMHAWLLSTDGTPLRTILLRLLADTSAGLAEATAETPDP
ncbi:TetR family transcriptional regulator [Salinifilum ghardaiensis]